MRRSRKLRETARMRTRTELGPGSGMGTSLGLRLLRKVGEVWDLATSIGLIW